MKKIKKKIASDKAIQLVFPFYFRTKKIKK